ncbi:MAG: hypothetical protein H6734_07545 [Alphaproteobacteria bacterium]|nr:hypothetical protein [Alphaproteobacteria bacterium]
MTLVRALENDGVCQSYVGILDDAAGTQVIARKLLPALGRDPVVLEAVRARIGDLLPLRHPGLLPLTHTFEHEGDLFLAHEWPDAVTLADVVAWCRENSEQVPLNLFLHVAVQICNALEGLHGQAGATTGAPSVLHLQVRPSSVMFTRDGEVLLGNYGLVPGPTFATQTGGFRLKTAYLSPEQTHADARQSGPDEDSEGSLRRLSPASDLFSLGAVLYELLVHKPMFEASSPLRTISKVRRAEVTTQLLEVKEIFPGVDRVLYRALSLNPRHRYQRAFVLREDLRGLMAEFSFSNIQDECRSFLEPLFRGHARAADELLPKRSPTPVAEPSDTEPTVLGKIDVDAIRRGLATSSSLLHDLPDDFDDEPRDYQGDGAPTGVFDAPSSPGPLERPVQYTEEAGWTEIQPRPPSARKASLDQLRDALGPEGRDNTEEPTADDLNPIDFTAEEIDLGSAEPADPHAETQVLVPPSAEDLSEVGEFEHTGSTRDPRALRLVLGAGVASVFAAGLTLCVGGTLIGAVASRIPDGPVATAIEPARGRPTLRPTGKRAWRQVPAERQSPPRPWVPLVGELPGSTEGLPPADAAAVGLELAIRAMDEGDYKGALRLAGQVDASALPADRRAEAHLMLLEVVGGAHRALYERSSTPDPEHLRAATAAWARYRDLAGSAGEARADRHLAHLSGLGG